MLIFNPAGLDAAGALPVSQKSILGNYVQDKDELPLLLDRDGTGTQTWAGGVVNMVVDVGEYAVCQSFKRHLYLAGKAQEIDVTFNAFGVQANVNKKVGLYSSSTTAPYNSAFDGIYLEMDGTTHNFVIAKGGTLVKVARSTWDDPLDGTGASGLNVDFDDFTFMIIDYLYLGGTAARLKFNVGGELVIAHTYKNSSILSTTFINSPVQPVRWEIRSTGGIGAMGANMRKCNDGGSSGRGRLPTCDRYGQHVYKCELVQAIII